MGSIILDHVIWPIQQIVHFLSIQFLCDYVYMQTIFAHFFYVCNNEAGGQVRTFFYPPRNCIIGRKFNSIINRKPNRLLVPITLWLANLQILCLQIVWDRQTDRQRKHKSANCYYYCYVVVVIGLGTMHSPKIQYLQLDIPGGQEAIQATIRPTADTDRSRCDIIGSTTAAATQLDRVC